MRAKKVEMFPYLLLLPAVLMMVVVNVTPILQGFYMSMLKLNQYTLNQYLDAPFIGLENYRRVLFEDHSPIKAGLSNALRNTLLYTLMVSVFSIAIGLGVAVLLNRDFPHALRYSIDGVRQSLDAIQRTGGRRPPEELLASAGKLHAMLRYTTIDEILEGNPGAFLHTIREHCQDIHDLLYRYYVQYSIQSALAV